MRTTDNTKILFDILKEKHPDEVPCLDDLQILGNKKIKDIKPDENPNLLVFPSEWNAYHDDVDGSEIFSLSPDNVIETKNIMGFIGLNETNLTIASRFAESDNNDYFLHYMLQRVMAINVLDLKHSGGKNDIWDFLVFLFPYFLNKALSQGLYKEYKRNEYNDANVRGVIDVKRHFSVNIPFSGKVAYSAREHNYDNPVLQIIRHTIEYIKTHKYNGILTANTDTFSNINQVTLATSGYNKNSRQKIIDINKKKPVVHPYFIEYKALQRLCIRILSYEKISSNNEKEKIHGILFDGAWLWEEYLNTILRDLHFRHPSNKKKENGYRLFEDGRRIYPDFVKETETTIIADAKYKRMENYLRSDAGNGEGGFRRRDNSDYYQLMAYMLRFDSSKGCLIFPHQGEIKPVTKQILKGMSGEAGDRKIVLLGFNIPQNTKNYTCFKGLMKKSEDQLCDYFKRLETG